MADENIRDEKTKQSVNYNGNNVIWTEKFYSDAKEYWNSVNPTIDGMLGGYAKISPTDINGSRAFIRPLLKVCLIISLRIDRM